jgi:hypothetical protein
MEKCSDFPKQIEGQPLFPMMVIGEVISHKQVCGKGVRGLLTVNVRK